MLDFNRKQVCFFGHTLPDIWKWTEDEFCPPGLTEFPNTPTVVYGHYESRSDFIRRFERNLRVQSLSNFTWNGEPFDRYDLVLDGATINLRSEKNVVGSYSPRLLDIVPDHRGRGLSTLLVLAKVSIDRAPPNLDRRMTTAGRAAIKSAYRWACEVYRPLAESNAWQP